MAVCCAVIHARSLHMQKRQVSKVKTESAGRKPYVKPSVRKQGRLCDITEGPAPGLTTGKVGTTQPGKDY